MINRLNTLEDVMSFYNRTANNIIRDENIDEKTLIRLNSLKDDIIEYINKLTNDLAQDYHIEKQ